MSAAVDELVLPETPAPATPLYVPPPAGTAAMRVLVLAPRHVPAWLTRFVELAAEDRWIEPIVVPVSGVESPVVRHVPMGMRIQLGLERRRKHRSGTPLAGSLDPVCIDALRTFVPLPPLDAGLDLAQVRRTVTAQRPCVILLFAREEWAEALAGCAEHGCWVVDAAMMDSRNGGLHLLAPMLARAEATPVALELAYADGRVQELEGSRGSTQLHSFIEQRERAMRKLPALLARSLRKLAAGGFDLPAHRVARLRPVAERMPFAPGLRVFASTARSFVRKRLDRRRGLDEGEPWRLLLRASGSPINPEAPVVDGCTALQPAEGDAWADPCLVATESGRRLLFAEEVPCDLSGDGRIVCLELGRQGDATRLGVALEESFHLSYPQPFRWEGQWYMTVESGAARRASLYRAEDFPLRWTRVADLIQGRHCVDPTLHRHDGRWYLFANVSEGGGSSCDDLFLFVADHLEGPYRPHPANPIVTDVRHARPAGRLFERGGRLIRPAQNCGPRYGAEVAFREVTVLDPDRYEERPLGTLALRGPGVDGCHTYNAIPGLEVLDVRDRAAAPR